MAELRIIYDRTEGDALDVFAWLAEAHPRALAGYGSSLKRLAPEVRPDEYIDLRTPTLGLKLRGGFGKRQQGLELKTCQSKDSTTGTFNFKLKFKRCEMFVVVQSELKQ